MFAKVLEKDLQRCSNQINTTHMLTASVHIVNALNFYGITLINAKN